MVDMQTGKPVDEADIRFYNLNGKVVIEGKTNAEGFYEANIDLKEFQTVDNIWDPEFWVTASKAGDFTFLGSHWNDGMRPWNFNLPEDFRGPESPEHVMDAYLYTERNVYRPGDTVYFKGIVRLRDKNGTVLLPKQSQDINIIIRDSQYNEIFNETVKPNAFGSFSGELPIDPEASLGRYDLSIRLLPEESVDRNYSSHSFSVLEYRKPEYQVEVVPEEENYFSGDTLTFTIKGNYYFGAPMNDAEVTWNARTADFWFNRYTDGWYSFTLEDSWCWWYCEAETEMITEGEGTLDKEGNMEVEFPFDIDDKATSQIVTLEADITDPNNQVVSNRESVPVHKASLYVGVRMEDYAVSPGEKAKVKVVTVDPDGTPIPNERVTLSLFSREWNTIKKKSVDGYYYYENEPKDTFVRKTSVTTDKDGKAIGEIEVKEGGSYRIVAEATDSKGRSAKAGTSLYVYSRTYINWPHSNNDRVEVVADKPEYKVGDTAKLLVKSPYQGEGVKALVTVERENVMSKKLIDIESNAQPIEIPVTEDLIPNAYVSVVIIKARDGETFDENGNDTGMPKFKIGYAKLKVETSQKKLDIDLSTDRMKYGPGETVNVDIMTKDYLGNPVQAEISLGVVDLSVQALLGFTMPDLIKRFYEDRGLGVKTSQMLTYLIEIFKPGSKGGGGGDPETKARTNFKDTAYWNPNIVTGENGQATVSFKLPDNLTTWQLLGIAHSKNHQYGAAVHEIIETKKTILRPLRPRFAVEGDEIKLGATVHNFTDETKNFTVTLLGEGFEADGEMEQQVTIKSDEMETLAFPIKVNRAEELVLHFKAEAQNAVDEIEEKIPVYEFGTQQAVATTGWTEENMAEQLYIPSDKEARNGTFSAILSPTLASYLPGGLEYLARFPYGCAEQTVSGILPNVALKSLQGFEAFKIVDDATLRENIIGGLEKLYKFQRGDGGFGYWYSSQKSYPYLTAYIVYALDAIQKAGYSVDNDVIYRANNYLSQVLRSQDMEDKISLTTRAYILFVMAETGRRDLNLANNLFEKREELPLFAKAHLAMTFGKGNNNGMQLLSEILNQVKIDSRGAHFEEENEGYWRFSMNTNTRTTALVLQAMVRMMPDQDLIPKVVRHMLAVREDGRWDTTQSTVTSLFAFIEFLKSTGELNANFDASVSVEGEDILTETFTQENILSKAEVVKAFEDMSRETYSGVIISKEGAGRLYYDLILDYFLTLDYLPPTDQGIGLMREITPLDEGEKGFHTKGTYKTKLTITVPEDRHFVAISSPLPAGLEPVDFTLETSQRRLQEEVNQPDDKEGVFGFYWWNPLWYFNHIEFRDDEVFLFADYLPAGVYRYEYLTRATTPGKYRHRPARAWEMYFPETFGQTEGDWLIVEE